MCDGHRDETMWTLRSRQTGHQIVTSTGHNYLFAEESDALEYAHARQDAADVEVVPIDPAE